MAMPSLFYHNFQTNTSDNLVISSLEERSAISGERLGHKAAIGGTVRYRKNLEFSAGLIYAWANESFNFTEKTITGYQTLSANTETTSFAMVPEFSENIKLKSHFSVISVFYKLDYRLLPQLDLILQPTFNYSSFINENESSPVYIKPNNLSINFGLSYHL